MSERKRRKLTVPSAGHHMTSINNIYKIEYEWNYAL